MTSFDEQTNALIATTTETKSYVSFRSREVTKLTAKARRWVLRGIVPAEPSILAAGQGTGKSHAIFTMALQVAFPEREIIAGLQGTRQRHIVMFMEGVEAQVPYFIRGLAEYHGIPLEEIEKRFSFYGSTRDSSEQWAGHFEDIWTAEEYQVNGTPPWVIIDTLSSNIDTTNENDNSEAASIVDALTSQRAYTHGGSELPLLVVTHTAKGATSTRGASAFEGNIHHVMHLKMSDAQKPRGIWLEKNRAGESQCYAMWTAKGDNISIKVPNDYGDLDERGRIIMDAEDVFVVKAATHAYACEHKWLDKSDTNTNDKHADKLSALKEVIGDGYEGSQNDLADAVGTAWKDISKGTGRSTVTDFIRAEKAAGTIAQIDGLFTVVSEADPPASIH